MNDLMLRRKMFIMGAVLGFVFGLVCLLSKNQIDIMVVGISISGLITAVFLMTPEKKDVLLINSPIPLVTVLVLVFSPEKEAIEKIYLFGKFFLGSLVSFLILVYIVKSRLKNLKKLV